MIKRFVHSARFSRATCPADINRCEWGQRVSAGMGRALLVGGGTAMRSTMRGVEERKACRVQLTDGGRWHTAIITCVHDDGMVDVCLEQHGTHTIPVSEEACKRYVEVIARLGGHGTMPRLRLIHEGKGRRGHTLTEEHKQKMQDGRKRKGTS